MAGTDDAGGEGRPSRIHVTVIIQNRYTFDTEVGPGSRSRRRPASQAASFSIAARRAGTS